MRPRIQAGKHRGVRRHRPGSRRARLFEDDTPRGHSIERGRRFTLVSVTAEPVGPQRVDRDQDCARGPPRTHADEHTEQERARCE